MLRRPGKKYPGTFVFKLYFDAQVKVHGYLCVAKLYFYDPNKSTRVLFGLEALAGGLASGCPGSTRGRGFPVGKFPGTFPTGKRYATIRMCNLKHATRNRR